MIVIKIILNVLQYIGIMFSISFAVAIGVTAGLKNYFNKSSKGGN